jgi:hypothetical protein
MKLVPVISLFTGTEFHLLLCLFISSVNFINTSIYIFLVCEPTGLKSGRFIGFA